MSIEVLVAWNIPHADCTNAQCFFSHAPILQENPDTYNLICCYVKLKVDFRIRGFIGVIINKREV